MLCTALPHLYSEWVSDVLPPSFASTVRSRSRSASPRRCSSVARRRCGSTLMKSGRSAKPTHVSIGQMDGCVCCNGLNSVYIYMHGLDWTSYKLLALPSFVFYIYTLWSRICLSVLVNWVVWIIIKCHNQSHSSSFSISLSFLRSCLVMHNES